MSVRENDDKTTQISETTPVSTTAPACKIIEEILTSQEIDGKLTVVVKWVDIEEPQLILAEQFNLLYPQEIIAFYQARLKFC
ncbi:unnamed protein product [Macrosiphum euphorbiae]|uniref:Chromo shadow domain-containing protein n=1 Tax=Macrosiphum euphorbiae TaxID=13131 RepID=A0AAV0WBC5_9HEMI|nr:unnamed protein product [Macrosiphum euphorbiae]